MKRSELFFSVFQVPLDFGMLLAGFITAYFVRGSGIILSPEIPGHLGRVVRYGPLLKDIMPFTDYLHYVVYIVPVMVLIFGVTGLYAMRRSVSWGHQLIRIFLGVSVGLFFILLLFLLRNDFFLPRSTVLYAWFFCTLFVVLGRLAVRLVQRLLLWQGIGVIRVAIVGPLTQSREIMQSLQRSPLSLYELRARFDALETKELMEKIEHDEFDELIVINEYFDVTDLIRLRNHCLEHQVTFSFVPALFTELSSSYEIRSETSFPMIEVQPTPLDGWGRVMKRLFDFCGALMLLIIFSPLFLFIYVWLKIASPGPVFYQQERIGRNFRPIRVWKFRSMYLEYCTGPGYDGDVAFQKLLRDHPDLAEEWKATTKLKNDPRVSRPGKFLRLTSLDELPQFFNVLTGSLSLVGPRPIVQEEIAKYGEKARILFTVKPGLTGLWQVSGRNDLTFQERVALDAHYIEHWNLLWDLLILVRTIPILLPGRGKGAY